MHESKSRVICRALKIAVILPGSSQRHALVRKATGARARLCARDTAAACRTTHCAAHRARGASRRSRRVIPNARFLAGLHVVHVAQHEGGSRALHAGAHKHRGRRVLPAEFVAEHTGHPARGSAARRTRGVRVAARARGDAVESLGDLRPRVRADGARRTARLRRVPREREVRAKVLGHHALGQPRADDRRHQSHPPRAACSAAQRGPVLPHHRRRHAGVLQQESRR